MRTRKDWELWNRLVKIAPAATVEDARVLRMAERTLQKWGEGECGDSNDYCSWCITRDETTGKPFREIHSHQTGKVTMLKIADRESGAIKRVKSICERLGLHYYQQGDPRGCCLYVSAEPYGDFDYNRSGSIACCE